MELYIEKKAKQNVAQRNISLRDIYIMERFGHTAGYWWAF